MQDYAPKVFDRFIPSNSGIKKAIKKGQILRNGKIAQTGSWISEGEVLELLEDVNSTRKVYEFSLEIVFEDDHLAVINKPAGMTVSGNSFKTVFNALKKESRRDGICLNNVHSTRSTNDCNCI